ncbi:thioesterase domain-containing protein [Streptomyces sp. NBC_01261]|uniref:thioesterase II family protein n=1 Tax=unclassified Streptomyces TaxID=2593676 RepID=UPI002E291B9E|nr:MULTISPECIES: alpha/beta fold hydrolase [unclassified Streptomyces]
MSASHTTTANSAWISARYAPVPPHTRIVCLPHAGGGAGVFGGWRPHVPAGIELAPVDLPGRGARIDEPVAGTFDELLDSLFGALRGEFTMPYAIYGHSFGALLGYELTLRIEREIEQGEPLLAPVALLVSGSRAPHVPLNREPVTDGDDARLVSWLRETGGLPEELLAFPGFLTDLLRAVRSDIAFAERYLVPGPVPVACPVVALAGREDTVSPVADVEPWAAYTTAAHRLCVLPGGHYFPQSRAEATVRAVMDGLFAVTAPRNLS